MDSLYLLENITWIVVDVKRLVFVRDGSGLSMTYGLKQSAAHYFSLSVLTKAFAVCSHDGILDWHTSQESRLLNDSCVRT